MEQAVQIAPDFSVYGLVMHADPVVKGVLIILVLASIACWAVILEKAVRLIGLSWDVRRLREAETKALVPQSEHGLTRAVLIAAEREADDGVGHDESRERGTRSARTRHAFGSKDRDAASRGGPTLPRHSGLGRALHRLIRNGMGHRQQLYLDCAAKGHESCRCGTWNCRGVDCDSSWSCGCDSRGGRL